MGPVPRLSLCIPTHADRSAFLKVALASAVQEALAHPPGTVETFTALVSKIWKTPKLCPHNKVLSIRVKHHTCPSVP